MIKQNNIVYVPWIGPGNGFRYILTVYDTSFEKRLFNIAFNAPSMVTAGNMFTYWRDQFLKLNEFNDENFIYELYNISLGKRRIIK